MVGQGSEHGVFQILQNSHNFLFSSNAKNHIPIFEVTGGFFNFHSESSSYPWRYLSNRWADAALRDLVQWWYFIHQVDGWTWWPEKSFPSGWYCGSFRKALVAWGFMLFYWDSKGKCNIVGSREDFAYLIRGWTLQRLLDPKDPKERKKSSWTHFQAQIID